MNVYDFDKTIYDGDSTADFYKYTFFKYPKTRKYLFVTIWAYLLYIVGYYTKTHFKEKMYSFLKGIPDIDEAIKKFWDIHENKIKNYYIRGQKADDMIISASPEFLLEPICERLNIHYLIASRVDKFTGKYDGENCYGEEKVRRLNEYMSDYRIEEFYSDSLSDDPLACLAETSYIVIGEKLVLHDEYVKSSGRGLKSFFCVREFPMFLIIGVVNTLTCIVLSYIMSFFIQSVQTAFSIGYAISLVVGYVLNSKFTFRKKISVPALFKYVVSYIPNFIIQKIIIHITFDLMSLPKLPDMLIAAVLGTPITFAFMKLYAFAGRKK